jgi:hypothetical protein
MSLTKLREHVKFSLSGLAALSGKGAPSTALSCLVLSAASGMLVTSCPLGSQLTWNWDGYIQWQARGLVHPGLPAANSQPLQEGELLVAQATRPNRNVDPEPLS